MTTAIRARYGARLEDAAVRVHARAGEPIAELLRRPRLAMDAMRLLAAGDHAGARRRGAVLAARGGTGRHADAARATDILRDALDAALVPPEQAVRIVGARGPALAHALGARLTDVRACERTDEVAPGDVVVLSGALESRRQSQVDALLSELATRSSLVFAHLPLWPESRSELPDEPIRLLRSGAWWTRRFARHGWEPALQWRRSEDGLSCIVFQPEQAANEPANPAPQAAGPRIRINDDLSVGGSFTWISASIGLALQELGVPVSIAPTRMADSIDPRLRAELQPLIESSDDGRPVDCELGWTHFWGRYQRPLGGRLPLALFAINYEFGEQRVSAHDPWMRRLIEADMPLAPISTFCRDVLVRAGVAPERLHVVPMAYTYGIETGKPAALPAARGLRLLHVTNALDAERNGTPLALEAFAKAFAPDDDVTLVVRDYASGSADLNARIVALQRRGFDIRYWPVFLAPDRLGALIGAFDALLAPFRGEGFGIKLLDAMACGVPVIGPLYGGPRDFMDADVAFPVAYDLVPVGQGYDAERLRLGNEPQWAECRLDDLVRVLRAVASDPEDVRLRGSAAREHVLTQFTWHNTARRIVDLVHGIPR